MVRQPSCLAVIMEMLMRDSFQKVRKLLTIYLSQKQNNEQAEDRKSSIEDTQNQDFYTQNVLAPICSDCEEPRKMLLSYKTRIQLALFNLSPKHVK